MVYGAHGVPGINVVVVVVKEASIGPVPATIHLQ